MTVKITPYNFNVLLTRWISTMLLYLLSSCLKSRYLQRSLQVIPYFLFIFRQSLFLYLQWLLELFLKSANHLRPSSSKTFSRIPRRRYELLITRTLRH
ncbi:hypothetical protein HanRHA438_Chr16g0752511 [Helianthus annuus]|nr:hypothetical protein HanRHA438_Chr16g0752511 [Helianthus annuus]